MKEKLETTPAIHADSIQSQKYLGVLDHPEGEIHIVMVKTTAGRFLVANGACNAGLIPDFARRLEDGDCEDEALQEFAADLEDTHPSGELLAWHGSLVI